MDLLISKKNEVYLKVEAEPHLNYELADFFTFEVESAKFMQKKRRYKGWDGKIRLYSPATGEIYCGLVDYLTDWAEEKGYQYSIEEHENFGHPQETNEFVTPEAVGQFVKSLRVPFPVRDYQYKAIYEALRYNRRLLLSPTASGKSLMIYALIRYHTNVCRNVLVVVPTTSLVEQMYKDFEDYSWKAEDYVQRKYYGYDIDENKPVVVSTWQSLATFDKKWFERFDCVIGDEAHLYKSKELQKIMGNLVNANFRIGTTGTLDDSKVHKLVLEGLFGPVTHVTTTKDLIDKKQLADLKIQCIVLKYPKEEAIQVKNLKYQEEMDYIVSHEKRNNFIKNLTKDQTGNTLVLFQYVEKHGKILYDLISDTLDHQARRIFFVFGGTETKDRETIRSITENENDAIIVASYGTFSTGINIRNLHNVIFASPTKSKIRVLQSLGRGLRLGDNKAKATLYDLADDITYGTRKNFTLNHFMERVGFYTEQEFDYEIHNVDLI